MSMEASSREVTLQKGTPVNVVFFGEHAVRGVVADVHKATVVIAMGQNAWALTAPRKLIRQQKNELVLDLG
jgi:hypothetical protein